jgi:hypothetical protein
VATVAHLRSLPANSPFLRVIVLWPDRPLGDVGLDLNAAVDEEAMAADRC